MTCTTPNCEGSTFARGLCQPCYYRLRRNGTVERKNAINRGTCTFDGCDRKAHAKNLCAKHYLQQLHPLRLIWRNLRSRAQGAYPPSWTRFEAFLSDVGERPSSKHQLRRPDPARPWGPDNFAWREPVRVGGKTGLTKDMAAYQRAWSYLRKFGLREEDLERMKAAQRGLCPICDRPLERIDIDTGKPVRICLDHDHITGAARDLLCDPCNKGLGAFEEDPSRLRAAIAYLDSHATKA